MEAQFITDHEGNRISVILPIEVYNKILDELEELDDIRLYDEAKAQKSDLVSAEKAFEIIERHRKK